VADIRVTSVIDT